MSSSTELNDMSRVELENEVAELELRLKNARSRLQDAGKPSIRNPSMDQSHTDRMFLISQNILDPSSTSDLLGS